MHWNPLKRSPIKRKAKKARVSSGRVRLDGKGMNQLRQNVFARSQNESGRHQCENNFQGERCKAMINWMMFDMHHMQSRGRGGSDSMENCIAVCWSCHRMHHNGHIRIFPHKDWIANV